MSTIPTDPVEPGAHSKLGEETARCMPADPEQWVDQYGDLLLGYALRQIPQREAAEDLVQETFLAAWRGRKDFKGNAQFDTWLVGILRNKIRDLFRGSKRKALSLDDAINEVEAGDGGSSLFDGHGHWKIRPSRWSDLPDQSTENAEFWGVLQQCLAGLPGHLAKAFRLKLTSRKSNQEISQSLGVTPSNLSVRLHRARLLLRNCLQRRWFDD